MWEGPSKSGVARTNRPTHMGSNANPGKSSISSQRYCIFENRVARAPVNNRVWKTQHVRCEMATFVNLSNTSQLICIIVESPRKYEKNKQKWLFGVDCCCAAIVVVLRRLENIIFENALPPSEFARCLSEFAIPPRRKLVFARFWVPGIWRDRIR